MTMRTPGIIVEGRSGRLSLLKLYPRAQATDLGGLGHQLAASAIAQRALPFARLHLAKGRRVVISVDRESRDADAVAFANSILAAIPADIRGKARVVVADRMLENWILADVGGIRRDSCIRKTAKQKRYEGTHGKDELQSIMENTAYDEALHAPRLIGLIRVKQAEKNSASFGRLRQAMVWR